MLLIKYFVYKKTKRNLKDIKETWPLWRYERLKTDIADKNFRKLTENYLKWKYLYDPIFATNLGIAEYDKFLSDYSIEAREGNIKKLFEFQNEAEKILESQLSSENRIDRFLLLRDIKLLLIKLRKIKHRENNPMTYLEDCFEGIYSLMTRTWRPPEYTAEMILHRLKEISKVFREGKKNLKYPPPVFLKLTLNSIKEGIDFIDTVNKNFGRVSPVFEKDFEKFSKEAKSAFVDFEKFLTEDLEPGKEYSYALGKELFSEVLKVDYTLDKDVEEILEGGKISLKRAEKGLREAAEKIEPGEKWQNIYKKMRSEVPKSSKLLRQYEDYVKDAKKFLLKNNLITIPDDISIKVIETPKFMMPIIPIAAYKPPGPYDNYQAGNFWVTPLSKNGEVLYEHNIYFSKITAFHEAYPGHHLQCCLSNRQESLFRKQTYSDVTGEGWALYCEEMMEETGYLNSDKMVMARLAGLLTRAARVFMDVGLHTKTLTIEEGAKLFTDRGLFSEETAIAEVEAFAPYPGQAASYVTGMLEIMNLREEYKKLKGKDYSLKEFHDRLLSCGALPLRVIKHIMINEDL